MRDKLSEELREQFEKWQNEDIPQFNGELKYKDVNMSCFDGFQACAKIKDAEIAELKYELDGMTMFRDGKVKEIEQLNAKVAMLLDALDEAMYCNNTQVACDKANAAIKATEADVTKWVNGVKADALQEIYEGGYVNFPVMPILLNKIKEIRGE
jgi:hypothetical protein